MATARAVNGTGNRRATTGRYDTEQFLWSFGGSLAALVTALAVIALI